jgi:hypothetical protein
MVVSEKAVVYSVAVGKGITVLDVTSYRFSQGHFLVKGMSALMHTWWPQPVSLVCSESVLLIVSQSGQQSIHEMSAASLLTEGRNQSGDHPCCCCSCTNATFSRITAMTLGC